MNRRVAVIDVGSNSIKALVAEKGACSGELSVVFDRTLEVRISRGIGSHNPVLDTDRMLAGVEAVQKLWAICREYGPLTAIRIVGTAALRSAANGSFLLKEVAVRTGIQLQVLSGDEEADAIATGVRTDPGIPDHLHDFTVFDLGGGSLEIIRYRPRAISNRVSLPLGVVWLTEKFIEDPSGPVTGTQQDALAAYVRDQITLAGLIPTHPLVGCGGGLSAVRQLRAGETERPLTADSAFIERSFIDQLARVVLFTDLAGRKAIPGMPASRADILPATLIVFQELMTLAAADGILHSLHNLRYGLALRMLEAETPL